MGPPVFDAPDIPVRSDDPLHTTLETSSGALEAAVLGMGNPHTVLFVDDPDKAPVTTLGPEIEWLAPFPNGTNVEWVSVQSADRVRMRVWERGSGQTLACGTGACAAAVATRVLRDGQDAITVVLPGGEVRVEWAGSLEREAPVFLIGAAERTFTGTAEVEDNR